MKSRGPRKEKVTVKKLVKKIIFGTKIVRLKRLFKSE